MEPGLRPGCSNGHPPSHNLPAMLATAWSPEEHCLLTADKGTVSGMSLKQKVRPQSQPLSPTRLSHLTESRLCVFLANMTFPSAGYKDQGNKPNPIALSPLQARYILGRPHLSRRLLPRAPEARALPSCGSPRPGPAQGQPQRSSYSPSKIQK